MSDPTFLITRPSDVVQKAQMEGRYFYERLHPVFSDMGEIKNALIVGAGTGDLSVFLGRERGVARLTLIEPDVSQHENLLENCTRNIDSELDLRYLGYAAGAESGRARMERPYSTYRGGARLIADFWFSWRHPRNATLGKYSPDDKSAKSTRLQYAIWR